MNMESPSLEAEITDATIDAVASIAEHSKDEVATMLDLKLGEGLGMDSLEITELKMEIEEEIKDRSKRSDALKPFDHGADFELPDSLFKKKKRKKHRPADTLHEEPEIQIVSEQTTVRELIRFVLQAAQHALDPETEEHEND